MTAGFDRLAAALFEAAGWDPPFDDMLPPDVRAQAARHGGVRGECLDPERCPGCAEARRDLEAAAWRERWAGTPPATLRAVEVAARAFGEALPDPRSREALDLVRRARG